MAGLCLPPFPARAAFIIEPIDQAGSVGLHASLVVDSQGCADIGVCYPPFRQRFTVALPVAKKGATGAAR